MTNMPQEKIFNGKATQLNYLDWGPSSAEALVMLHGGAWSWQEYLSLIPSLAERWHVYALDFRGNGGSGWVQDTYRVQDFAEDTAQFLLELQTPAVLIGHSLGGVVALILAARCADGVKALVLEDSTITLENYRRIIESSRDLFGLWLELKKQAQSEQELVLLLAQKFKGYPGVTSSWLLYFARCLWQLDPTYFNTMLRDFGGFAAGYDGQRLLKEISCPVICLRGEPRLGAVMTDEEISWIQQNCQHVRCVQIGGVGHLLHLESQGQMPVLTAIMDFLAEPRVTPCRLA
jgi:pimeloyl-ACP methyl ester carboxylesterase